MNPLILMFLLVLNFTISWWNAYQGGKYWTEVKIVGGWPRILVWATLIMAAVGFSWVYLTLLTLGTVAFKLLTPEQAEVMFDLGYLLLVPFLLGSGMVIWANSLIVAWRRRTLGNVGVAAWNTFAQVHNTWQAASHAGDALGSVTNFFLGGGKNRRSSSSSGNSAAGFAIILLVVLAISGGIITTVLIARNADRRHALDVTLAFK